MKVELSDKDIKFFEGNTCYGFFNSFYNIIIIEIGNLITYRVQDKKSHLTVYQKTIKRK